MKEKQKYNIKMDFIQWNMRNIHNTIQTFDIGVIPNISENVLVKLRNYFAPYDRELFEFIREKPFWNI